MASDNMKQEIFQGESLVITSSRCWEKGQVGYFI